MKKLIGMLFIALGLFAYEDIDATKTNIVKLQHQKITIVDIRTKGEWIDTGVIKGVKTLTFFDERGKYNAGKFLEDLNKLINKKDKFAIICRTGNRTSSIAPFLVEQGYRVINLKGGISLFKRSGGKFTKYQ